MAFWLLPWWGVLLAAVCAAVIGEKALCIIKQWTPAVSLMGTLACGVLVAVIFSALPGQDRDCAAFTTHAEAQRFYESEEGFFADEDPHGLDGDGDGRACESLP